MHPNKTRIWPCSLPCNTFSLVMIPKRTTQRQFKCVPLLLFWVLWSSINLHAQPNGLSEEDLVVFESEPDINKRIRMMIDSAYDSPRQHLRLFFYHKALKLAQKHKDEDGEAYAYTWKGSLAFDAGQYDSAEVFHQRALNLRKKINNHKDVLGSINNLGLIRKALHRYEDAIAVYLRGVNYAEAKQIPPIANLANINNNLGTAYRLVGKIDSAAFYFGESMRISNYIKSVSLAAKSQYNIGVLLQDNKREFEEAYNFLTQSLESFILVKDSAYMGKCYLSLGNNAYFKGNSAEALRFFIKADSFSPFLSTLDKGILLKNTGEVLATELDYDGALIRLKASLDTFRSIGNHLETNAALWGISRCEQERTVLENKRLWNIIKAASAGLIVIGLIYALIRIIRRKNKFIENQGKLEDLQNKELEVAFARIEGQEFIQKKIGQELHDGLGAMLSAIKINLPSDENNPKIGKVNNMIDEACEEVRRFSHQLSSVLLEKFGLKAQIEALADNIQQSGYYDVELITYQLEERLDIKIEHSLYRMVQELVNNTVKHANGKNISIQLSRFSDKIRIIFEDDGRGFDYQTALNRKTAGLINLHARVHDMNGEIQFDTQIGRGTIVSIDIPYQPEQ